MWGAIDNVMRPERQVRDDGYLTPDEVPDARSKRAFFVPTDPAWYGLLMGALAPLLEENAWRKFGDLSPEECALIWQELFFSAPTCGCELPGGGRIIRLNATTGQLEELSDDGEWIEPTGEYAVPPIEPRTGGTSSEYRCLAAANAANVLEILYESITDSIAHELELAEAYAALVTAFIAAVGWEFAPIAFALAAFFLAVFAVVYEIIKLIGGDLWDGTFTDVLKCALFDCASADGEGVVTFDWTCTQAKLAAGTDALNFDQVRLFNQLNFIIQVIGGADGLNQAGATTAITDADCSDCVTSWCRTLDLSAHEGDVTPYLGGDWADGIGWQATDETVGNSYRVAEFWLSLPTTVTIYRAQIVVEMTKGSSSFDADCLGLCAGAAVGDFTYCDSTLASGVVDSPPDPTQSVDIALPSGAACGAVFLEAVSSTNTTPIWSGSATIKRITVWGETDAPDWSAEGWDEC